MVESHKIPTDPWIPPDPENTCLYMKSFHICICTWGLFQGSVGNFLDRSFSTNSMAITNSMAPQPTPWPLNQLHGPSTNSMARKAFRKPPFTSSGVPLGRREYTEPGVESVVESRMMVIRWVDWWFVFFLSLDLV